MARSVTSGTIFTYWPRVVPSEACRSCPFAAFASLASRTRITESRQTKICGMCCWKTWNTLASHHLTDDSFRSVFAFAIAEKRIAIVTPLTPEQFSAQLAATEKKRLEAELIRDRKQRNQSNRVNHSNSSDGPSQRVVGFRAAMKQRQRFVEYRQAVADCHMAVSQLAWSRRESNLAQLLAVVRTRSPDVADALRVGNSTWSAANCNRSYV